jgi:hypothetical protein
MCVIALIVDACVDFPGVLLHAIVLVWPKPYIQKYGAFLYAAYDMVPYVTISHRIRTV